LVFERIENMGGSKKRLQMKLNLMDESEMIEIFCVRFDPDDTLLSSCKSAQALNQLTKFYLY